MYRLVESEIVVLYGETKICNLYYSIQKQLERAMDVPIDVIHVKQVCGWP